MDSDPIGWKRYGQGPTGILIYAIYIDNFLFLDYAKRERDANKARRSVTTRTLPLSGRDDRWKKEGCCGGTTLE